MFKNSFNAIKEQMTNSVNTIDSMVNRPLCISECVTFLNDKNTKFYKIKQNLYNNISESMGLRTILEFYTDYATQSSTLIEETIKFIKDKIDEFRVNESKFIDDDELLASHKNAILNELKVYQSDNREGYDYTVDKFVPDPKAISRFDANLFSDIFNPKIDNLEVNSFQNALDNIDLEQDLRKFRGALVGIAEELSSSEYSKMLHGIFRNNSLMYKELNIDDDYVKSIAEGWYKFKSTIIANLNEHISEVDEMTKNVLKKIEAVCKNNNGMTVAGFTRLLPGDIQVNKINGADIDQEGINMAPELMFEVNKYCKLKLDQLQCYLDNICLGFGIKIDACHDYIMQTQTILHDVVDVLDKPECYYDARKPKDAKMKKITDTIDKLMQDVDGDD